MKNRLSVFACLVLVCTVSLSPTVFAADPADPEPPAPEKGGYLTELNEPLPAAGEGWTRYEAEDAFIYGSTNDGTQMGSGPLPGTEFQSFFSGEGHMAASFFESNAGCGVFTPQDADFEAGNIPYVQFTVLAYEPGETTMRIGYNGADPNGAFILKVNDGENRQITLPDSDLGVYWNRMAYVEFPVTLEQGKNTIYVSRSICADNAEREGPWRNIDFIDIQDLGEPLAGDVDADGLVNSSDARLVLQYTVEAADLLKVQQELADLNEDGLVNSSDARAILQKTVEAAQEPPLA